MNSIREGPKARGLPFPHHSHTPEKLDPRISFDLFDRSRKLASIPGTKPDQIRDPYDPIRELTPHPMKPEIIRRLLDQLPEDLFGFERLRDTCQKRTVRPRPAEPLSSAPIRSTNHSKKCFARGDSSRGLSGLPLPREIASGFRLRPPDRFAIPTITTPEKLFACFDRV